MNISHQSLDHPFCVDNLTVFKQTGVGSIFKAGMLGQYSHLTTELVSKQLWAGITRPQSQNFSASEPPNADIRHLGSLSTCV